MEKDRSQQNYTND